MNPIDKSENESDSENEEGSARKEIPGSVDTNTDKNNDSKRSPMGFNSLLYHLN